MSLSARRFVRPVVRHDHDAEIREGLLELAVKKAEAIEVENLALRHGISTDLAADILEHNRDQYREQVDGNGRVTLDPYWTTDWFDQYDYCF